MSTANPGSNRLRGLLFAFLSVAWLSGCPVDGVPLDDLSFACQGPDDCLEGYACLAGVCARPVDAAVEKGPDGGEKGPDGGEREPPVDVDGADGGAAADVGRAPDPCSAEAVCSLHGKECGAFEALDPCGRSRSLECGSCEGTEVCGKLQPNVCD